MQVTAEQLPWFWPIVMMVLGGVFGSFFTCVLHRVPRGQSIVNPPSHCPACKKTLGALDLIPVFSWILSGGKCRHCGVSYGSRYVLIELLCVFIGLLSWLIAGNQPAVFIVFVIGLAITYTLLRKLSTEQG